MTVKTPKIKKKYKLLYYFLVLVLTVVSTFGVVVKVGEETLKNDLIVGAGDMSPEYDFDDSDIYVDGKPYEYNDDLINILFMGIDRFDETDTRQGQADGIFLISLDTKGKFINIFNISRNTLADFDIYAPSGNIYGSERKQICLSYAYGYSDKQSAENCVNAVSKLFYGIPINGYYAIRMNFLSQITDAVGGVKVTLDKDVLRVFPNNKEGDIVTLKGANVLTYLRSRGESNAPRQARHKIFISSFMNTAKSKVLKDLSLPLKIYNSLSDNANSSINSSSITYLATRCVNAKYTVIDVEGKYGFDGKFETFEADQDKLYDIVINKFYIEKN